MFLDFECFFFLFFSVWKHLRVIDYVNNEFEVSPASILSTCRLVANQQINSFTAQLAKDKRLLFVLIFFFFPSLSHFILIYIYIFLLFRKVNVTQSSYSLTFNIRSIISFIIIIFKERIEANEIN